MSVHFDQSSDDLPRDGRGQAGRHANPRGIADWLCLAATPTFAAMTLLTAITGTDMLCMSTPGVFPVGGMLQMYLLMSVFHLAPWLRLLGSRQDRR